MGAVLRIMQLDFRQRLLTYRKGWMMKKRAEDFIIFALDVPAAAEAEALVEELQHEVGMFKIGLELFISAGSDFVRRLTIDRGVKVFLDLKLHDIPVTVGRSMARVADLGVSMATVHCGENREMLEAAVKAAGVQVKVMAVTLLTSIAADDLCKAGYDTNFCRQPKRLVMHRAAMAHGCGCAGVICSGQEVGEIKRTFGKQFLTVTPGIRFAGINGRDDQRRTVTPAEAISSGTDYLVVGRPIRDAVDRKAVARSIAGQVKEALAAKC